MQCRFTTWLFQIAKYRVLDELRARERRVQTPIELDRVPPAAIAAAPEVGFEQMDAVFRAIGELNTDMRAALLLRDVVGLSYNEIAEALEISLATTKWRIFKARELDRRAPGRRGRAHAAQHDHLARLLETPFERRSARRSAVRPRGCRTARARSA